MEEQRPDGEGEVAQVDADAEPQAQQQQRGREHRQREDIGEELTKGLPYSVWRCFKGIVYREW